jgi:hypothetical protein
MLSKNLQFLLARRGQNATLVSTAYGAYDPTTGSNSNTPTPYTVKAYFAEYSLEEVGKNSITLGDRKVCISPVDTSGVTIPEPSEDDTISGVGDTVVIKSVQKIYNAATLVCYICKVVE